MTALSDFKGRSELGVPSPQFRPLTPAPLPSGEGERLATGARVGLAPSAAVLLLAIALQIHFGAFGDVSWMLTIGEKWLAGGRPYVDFVETNPPAAIALYLPALLLAQATALKAEVAIVIFGLLSGLGALYYAASIARAGGLLTRPMPILAFVAVAVVALLPGRTFDERDYFVALALLPALALWACRAARAPVRAGDALVIGLLLAFVLAIKPPYAAIGLCVAPYLWRRLGLLGLLACWEFWIAGLAFALYAAAVAMFFPSYVHDVMPDLAFAYLPVRETLGALAANAGTIGALATCGLALYLSKEKMAEPPFAVLALAALGGLVAYVIQGKGWLYQALPAAMFAALLAGLTCQARDLSKLRCIVALAVGGAVYALGALQLAPPFVAALALGALAHIACAPRSEASAQRLVEIAEMALAGMVGAMAAFYAASFPGADPGFEASVRALAPHPTIAAIAPGLGTGFPLTRNVDGVWTMRRQGMLMTSGARFLLSRHQGDAEALAQVIARDRDVAVEDLARERPDAILVSRINPHFYDWAVNDPAISSVLAGYALIASSTAKEWPVDLYARRDLVPLKGE